MFGGLVCPPSFVANSNTGNCVAQPQDHPIQQPTLQQPQQELTQTCTNGSIIPISSSCPTQLVQCYDGSIVSFDQCPPIPLPPTVDYGHSHHSHHHVNPISSSFRGGGAGHSPIIQQIPSSVTDYPAGQSNALRLDFVNSHRNILGDYEIKGSVTNTSPTQSLGFVSVRVTLYNIGMTPIDTEQGYANQPNIDAILQPGQSGSFDIYVQPDSLNGVKPAFLKLSYSWQ